MQNIIQPCKDGILMMEYCENKLKGGWGWFECDVMDGDMKIEGEDLGEDT